MHSGQGGLVHSGQGGLVHSGQGGLVHSGQGGLVHSGQGTLVHSGQGGTVLIQGSHFLTKKERNSYRQKIYFLFNCSHEMLKEELSNDDLLCKRLIKWHLFKLKHSRIILAFDIQ